ncbi:Protein FAM205A-4 [Lemmus lemmus]
MALSLVTTVPPPFLNPEVVRLLELHVKKLMHFQRWGLPRRVEESLRQLMPNPPMYFQLENNQPVSLLLNNPSRDYAHRFGSLPPETWCSFTDNQPTQTFWVSQWSNVELEQKAPCGQMTSPVKKFLFSRDHDILRGIWLLPEGQANNSRDKLQKTFTQLFCGLPSIHSESLVETFLGTRGLSKDTSEPSCKDPYLLKEASPFFLPPHVPPTAAPPPSSASPNKSLYECQAQINVPCLTLAECKTLEWHLLQRQLQLQWGLPAVIPGSPYEQSPIQYKPCNKAKPHETLKASWPGKSFSVLTRDLVFIPEHTRRLLEFHLQKQLIHLRWGLPQRIQRSIHLVLSSPGQQPRSCSSRALPNVSILQPGDPEADGSGDTFAVAVERGSFHTPHLFGQAKAMLKTHVDSKCGQIHQGKVPAYVQSSWECRIPRSLAVEASISSQHLELQAKNSPDLHHKAVSQEPEPAALDQEKQALSGTLTEHCKRPQTLSEETIKKLETMLRHKYLAFLSGLPVHYCVTPSRATSPATVSQSTNTEIMLGPVKPQEPLTQETLQEDPYWSRLEPCTQGENEASADIARDDNETSEDIAGEIQPKVQVAGGTEKVSLETQTQILAKLSFHLKKKILEIKLGIPIIANELKKSNVVDPESEYTQGPVGTLSIPESTALPQLLNSGNSPPVPDANRVLVGKQPATAWQAVCHKQNQPSSKAAPHDSAQWGSKASQLRNMVEAQVHCVQLETSGEKPNLEKTFNSEPQSPGKSEYSAHVPTLTEKSNESGKPESGKPKAVGDLEKGGARLGLSPASGKTHRDGDEEPEKRLPPETPQGSSEQRSLHLEVLCLPSPQDPSEFEFPDPPPEVLMETDDAQNIQDSLTKVDAVPEPARIAKLTQPVASKTYQGLPFPRPPTQGKPFRGQAWQDHISQRQMMPASPHASPSLPEAGLKNKMKSFLHSMSPKIKDKTHMEPTVSTSGKVSKPSKENVDKGLPQAKSPTKKTKTENCRGPKAQPASSERPVIASVLTAPHNLDSKLGPRSRQHGSVSVPGQPRHCPRHCPRLARATQYRNPP